MKRHKLILTILSFGLAMNGSIIYAQNANNEVAASTPPINWFNLDEEKDNIPGVSTERAYTELLKNKKSKKIVVAVLDDGIDVKHEDLKNKIWKNVNEIEGNGIDDDDNGYIDDINGWNFIGGKDGTPVIYDNAEITRMYIQYKNKIEINGINSLSPKESKEYKKIKKEIEEEIETYNGALKRLNKFIDDLEKSEKILSDYFNTREYTYAQVENLESEIDSVQDAREFILLCKKKNYTKEILDAKIELAEFFVNYYYNVEYDSRRIVGDNYENKSEKYYGNNKIVGPDASHGTHVAGIIAADRYNNLGIKGIADNVELMILRMCAFGDERDKDIANSIYYAVDNGAQIINMSFDKRYSPYKIYVDRAVEYAEKNGVLIIHSAGNDSENIDKAKRYPMSEYLENNRECESWIEVAASSWQNGENLAADFSNYGQNNVDLFAPGVDIYSTTINQEYLIDSGTSMSAPVVAGVAALVWSYYPELDAKQLKSILIKSAEPKSHLVNQPGKKNKKILFSSLSKSGGVINAYKAIMLAEKLTK